MAKKEIDPEKFYTPKEAIAFVGTASTADTQRQVLLRHIRDGRVEAVNLGGEKKPRYAIQGKHLLKYRDTHIKPGEYETK